MYFLPLFTTGILEWSCRWLVGIFALKRQGTDGVFGDQACQAIAYGKRSLV